MPRKGEASLSHLKSGLRFTPRPHPDTFAQLRMGRTESSHAASGRGRGCPMGSGRGDTETELGESWDGWGTQPRGQVLEVSLTSCPESTPASRPLSAAHIILAAFSMMEMLVGKGSTPFTHLLRDAFNLPAHGLSSHMTSSPNS